MRLKERLARLELAAGLDKPDEVRIFTGVDRGDGVGGWIICSNAPPDPNNAKLEGDEAE